MDFDAVSAVTLDSLGQIRLDFVGDRAAVTRAVKGMKATEDGILK